MIFQNSSLATYVENRAQKAIYQQLAKKQRPGL
jgi:hypothetical protein